MLAGDGFLHLKDEVPGVPDVVRSLEDRCPGSDELAVGNRRTYACLMLDEDFVTPGYQLVHPRGSDGDPVLVVLDFLGHAHLHETGPLACPSLGARAEPPR